LPSRVAAGLVRLCVFPFGARLRPPSDRLTVAAAHTLLDGAASRLRLTSEMFTPSDDEPGLGRLEHALKLAVAVEPLRAKLRHARHAKVLANRAEPELLDEAVAKGVITTAERDRLREAADARDEAIRVDEYAPREYPAHPEGRFATSIAIDPST
ncbi:MAG TPA: acyl-CoA dehydrogenase domain-containing protein, partial [Kofleriaceae bacterium]|nr:acyl-CoA dehydrogenase domain-containing protein [Kofleriaceae bacterium]